MKYLLLFASCFFSLAGMSQSANPEVISTSGTSFSNGSGQLDWTLGEPVTATLSGPSNDLTQGFHQPELTITSLNDKEPNTSISVFPNPTISSVQVKISDLKSTATIGLYTIEGKLLQLQTTEQPLTQIDMEKYPAGTYILNITNVTNTLITYKISKSK